MGDGDCRDIDGGTEECGELSAGDEGMAGDRCEGVRGPLSCRGCMGLALNIVDDGAKVSDDGGGCLNGERVVMERKGEGREQETQGDVNGIIDAR